MTRGPEHVVPAPHGEPYRAYARGSGILRDVVLLLFFSGILYLAYRELGHYGNFEEFFVTPRALLCTLAVFAALRYSVGARWACLFGFVTSLFLLVDRHLGKHLGDVFAALGKQLLLVVRSTTQSEWRAYLGRVTLREWLALPALSLAWLALAKLTPNRRRRPILLLAAVPAFLYSYDFITLRPFYDYAVELRRNGAVLRKRAEFTFRAVDANRTPDANYVMLIGESQRADHYHAFGYSRQNTPELDRWSGRPGFYSFDDVISGFTLTNRAVPNIVTRKALPDTSSQFPEKSIISAFREAGFRTYYITFLERNMKDEDETALIYTEADTFVNHVKFTGSMEDPGLLVAFDRALHDDARKRLFLIHMMGVHFKFEDRYTAPFDKFKPSYKTEPPVYDPAHRQILVNSYDNAIAFSDMIMGEFLARIDSLPGPAMMAFVSDHGASLFDDGKTEDRGLAKGSYHVPFFLYGNHAYWSVVDSSRGAHLRCNRKIPITVEYFFDTFLKLSQIEYPGYRPAMDLSASCLPGIPDRKVWSLDGRSVSYDDLPN
jgi:glucan phosphoethanolaminetransferase (alkaline phosphatase superfamily)